VTLAEGRSHRTWFEHDNHGTEEAQADQRRTPGSRRSRTSSEITKDTPERSLLAARAARCRTTTAARPPATVVAATKQRYRIIDFRRTGRRAPPPWPPSSTTRTATAASRCCTTTRREGLHPGPRDVKPGTSCRAAATPKSSRQRPPASLHPVGTTVHNVELKAGGGAKMAAVQAQRAAGGQGGRNTPRCACPAPRCAVCPSDCRATVGEGRQPPRPSSSRSARPAGTGGRALRPQTRGVAMNPVDHPLGGGEGKTSGGRHPVSPWASPRAAPRDTNKPFQQLIVRRRRNPRHAPVR